MKAGEDVTYKTLNSSLKKPWPECVIELDFEGAEAQVVEEIVSIGLDIDGAHMESLVKAHMQELATDLAGLQSGNQKMLVARRSTEEEEDGGAVSSDVIEPPTAKGNESQDFFAKRHSQMSAQ